MCHQVEKGFTRWFHWRLLDDVQIVSKCRLYVITLQIYYLIYLKWQTKNCRKLWWISPSHGCKQSQLGGGNQWREKRLPRQNTSSMLLKISLRDDLDMELKAKSCMWLQWYIVIGGVFIARRDDQLVLMLQSMMTRIMQEWTRRNNVNFQVL